jgi:hypothetical protein
MMPDPDAVAWLEDPDRLAHQRAAQPGGGHVCDEQCRPNPPAAPPWARDLAAAANLSVRDATELLTVLDTADQPPARRRPWWWLWPAVGASTNQESP